MHQAVDEVIIHLQRFGHLAGCFASSRLGSDRCAGSCGVS